VLDLDSGAPISGATVVIGSTLILGATPPPAVPAGDVSATTRADGTYTISPAPAGSPFVHVFAGAHAVLHAQLAAPAAGGAFADVKVTTPTADELAELNDPSVGLNTVRAQAGVGAVVFDEYALEAARAWTSWEMAHGVLGFNDPSVPAGSVNSSLFYEYVLRGGLESITASPTAFGNLAGGAPNAPGTAAMQAFLTEKSTNGPHYQNLVNPTGRWVGFGSTSCSTGCTMGAGTAFAQLFVVPPAGV
jgi:hypothetical protein